MTSPRGQKRREFPASVKRLAFKRCCGSDGMPKCETCGIVLRAGNIIFEHMHPDGLAGEPTIENCKVHCRACADVKTATQDNPRMAKADRVLRKTYGLSPAKRPMPGSRASWLKKRMDGRVERR